jgi:hypothetical protein
MSTKKQEIVLGIYLRRCNAELGDFEPGYKVGLII